MDFEPGAFRFRSRDFNTTPPRPESRRLNQRIAVARPDLNYISAQCAGLTLIEFVRDVTSLVGVQKDESSNTLLPAASNDSGKNFSEDDDSVTKAVTDVVTKAV
ncbi:hypothetical protein AVEN_115990-1 [Araneus ventricosus]|uniref:Uncharacterized protein n=1 Tax=Araneus ventricosus TaxID=182803 RepID=A0A4Y2EMH5_ARAVE|nr:hypothetical protein AVEN_115990-1 [Araneus ventricosus]